MKFIVTFSCLAAVAMALLLAAHNLAMGSPAVSGLNPGASCIVQFRRDALGSASSSPVSPLTGSLNGGETSVSGKLKSINAEWVVVEHAGEDL